MAETAIDTHLNHTPEIARAKPAVLKWEVPFLIDSQLTGEEAMIRDSAQAYCQNKLLSRVYADRDQPWSTRRTTSWSGV